MSHGLVLARHSADEYLGRNNSPIHGSLPLVYLIMGIAYSRGENDSQISLTRHMNFCLLLEWDKQQAGVDPKILKVVLQHSGKLTEYSLPPSQ